MELYCKIMKWQMDELESKKSNWENEKLELETIFVGQEFSKLNNKAFKNIADLKSFIKKNLIKDEMVICMGAGSISNWIREIGAEI